MVNDFEWTMHPIIDAHIHLDLYDQQERRLILNDLEHYNIEALISVSKDIRSAEMNVRLAEKHQAVRAAVGFHPEQSLPNINEMTRLERLIENDHDKLVAIGEVGLPYYTRQKNPRLSIEPYIEIVEHFIRIAKAYDLPIALHAIYEDANLICSLLEKHSLQDAHFHWFKGDQRTMERMIRNGYFISITTDVLYEPEIRQIVQVYPLSQMMVETDGPWAFKGPFKQQMTHPKMIHYTINEIAHLKGVNRHYVYEQIYEQTRSFYV